MITPEENAKELVEIFWTEAEDNDYISRKMSYKQAKQCALIAVDEIMDCTKNGLGLTKFSKEYWQEVKQEIEKL